MESPPYIAIEGHQEPHDCATRAAAKSRVSAGRYRRARPDAAGDDDGREGGSDAERPGTPPQPPLPAGEEANPAAGEPANPRLERRRVRGGGIVGRFGDGGEECAVGTGRGFVK